MKFVVIPELKGRWRWELRSGDEVLGCSAMSFGSHQMALVSIKEFRHKAPLAPIQNPGEFKVPENST